MAKLGFQKGPVEVFNTEDQPLYTTNVSTLETPTVVIPIEGLAAKDGVFYALTTDSISVVANGFLTLQLTNPAGSGTQLFISRISGGASVNTSIAVLRNATFPQAGTSLIPRNTNFTLPDNSIATAKFISQVTDPTVGGVNLNTVVQPSGLFIIEYQGRIILNPNTTMVVRMTNRTNQTNLLSLNMSFWQDPL
ncbi:DUF6143 family protein [Halalkalibacter sp. AB-rgal2]|uniref:DUF6143 family protein n=1 Tax=Halalkalibacter sp. AB-rgal2 TaxID=3242695 RepID=UPI00359D00C4